jgi:hypothetical protein
MLRALVRGQQQLRNEVADLRELLGRQAGVGARDDADRRVAQAIAEVIGPRRSFLSRDVWLLSVSNCKCSR